MIIIHLLIKTYFNFSSGIASSFLRLLIGIFKKSLQFFVSENDLYKITDILFKVLHICRLFLLYIVGYICRDDVFMISQDIGMIAKKLSAKY